MVARFASHLVEFIAAIAAALLTLGLAGCTSEEPLSESDSAAIAQLTEIAPRDSEIDGTPTGVECWKPSESMLDDEEFRVLCRVHYEQAGDERYRDMICIGNLTENPVTEYCYRWAYYTDMPAFEDKRGHAVV